MSDTTLRLAEACERAANDELMQMHVSEDDVCKCSSCVRLTEIEKNLRALAAALRNAVEVSSLNGTRIVNVVLTIGDA